MNLHWMKKVILGWAESKYDMLPRFTDFSNLRLCVYTQYAHENRNRSLIDNHWNHNDVYSEVYTNVYKCIIDVP